MSKLTKSQVLEQIQNSPQSYIYTRIGTNEVKYFNDTIATKRTQQINYVGLLVSQVGLSAQEFYDALDSAMKSKYGMTAREALVQVASGKNVWGSSVSGIGSTVRIGNAGEIDPRTGFPVSVMQEIEDDNAYVRIGSTPSTKVVASGDSRDLAAALESGTPSLVTTSDGTTYANTQNQETGKGLAVYKTLTSEVISVFNEEKDQWEKASAENTTEKKTVWDWVCLGLQSLGRLINLIASLININTDTTTFSAMQSDGFGYVNGSTSTSTSTNNLLLIGGLAAGVYFLMKD